MTTLKEFLNEVATTKWTTSKVEVDKIQHIIDTHCKSLKESIKNDSILQRGFGKALNSDAKIIDPSTGFRTSRDSSNLYQLMMDSSDKLLEYPSRSKSLICLTAHSTSYGERYVVIPFDGTKIAVCDESDFHDQLLKGDSEIETFGKLTISAAADRFSLLLMILNIKRDFIPNEANDGKQPSQFRSQSYLDEQLSKFEPEVISIAFLKYCSRDSAPTKIASIFTTPIFDENSKQELQDAVNFFKKNGFDGETKKFYELMKNNPTSRFTAISNTMMTPANLNLKLIEVGNTLPRRKECWFSGKALVVSFKIFGEILANYRASGMDIPQYTFEIFYPHIQVALNRREMKESVNLEVFKKGFRDTKKVLDDKYTLIASSGWINDGDVSDEFKITAKTDKGVECGWVTFKEDGNSLSADNLHVQPAHQRKGLASEMYKFARDLGNDLRPSSLQSDMGKLFWSKDHSK